jgi:PAS domain S-box-containing protein
MDPATELSALQREIAALREDNVRLQRTVEEVKSRLSEPEEIIRAIREGEVEALVVQEQGQEEIYAVQRYESVYRELVEHSLPYGVWLADAAGRLVYVSRQFLQWMETDLAEMREKGQFHFLPEEYRQRFAEHWEACRENGMPCTFEYTVKRSDGSERRIWTHGIRTQLYGGTPCWAGINLDVTEQRQIEGELREKARALEVADRRKDEFLALLGHELRNPMAVIQHGLHLIRETRGEEATFGQIMNAVTNQVTHLNRLVDDLLDIARINRGTVALRKQRVLLGTAVHNAIGAVRRLIESKNHQLSVSLPPVPIWLDADPTRLEQVLANLLNNAAKYTWPGGNIELSAVLEGERVAIHLKDSGVGISPDVLPNIFEPFVQAERGLDRSLGGLGIGLTVVRNLVELHGGSVEARSDGPDHGSEFIVRLPVAATGGTEVGDPGETGSEGPVSDASLRILLVEDSADLAQLLRMALAGWGHEIHVAHDGAGALATLRTHGADVVLLDIGLPEIDGYEVARRIRELQSDQQPLLVAVTGYGQERDRQRSEQAGFDHHLVKPVDLEQLRQILAERIPAAG